MITVLVGMIASGKSTYARKEAQKGVITVNDDAIVEACHADQYLLYDKRLKILYKSIENYIASAALMLGRPVLIDRGVNISKKSRKRWVALATCFDVPCQAIVFKKELPEIHANRRFSHDPRDRDYNYWLKCANHHDQQWETPVMTEGFSNIVEL